MTTDNLEKFADMLVIQPGSGDGGRETETDAENAPDPEAAEFDAGAGEDVSDDVEAAEGDEADSEDVTKDEADEKGEDKSEPKTYRVKSNGEDLEVSLDDLIRSYSGQAYIQKGMQEAAGERKQVEADRRSFEGEKQQFLAMVQSFQTQGMPQMPQAPDQSMIQTDPIGYMEKAAKYQADLDTYNQRIGQFSQMHQQTTASQQAAMQAQMQDEARKLAAIIPEFANPETAAKLQGDLQKTGRDVYGYSDDELSSVMDHRAIAVLRDAMEYRKIKDAAQKAKSEKKAPVSVKPQAKRAEPAQLARGKMLAEAKKSQSTDAWAKLLLG